VESEAFNGAYKKNPYNFKNFNVSFIRITVNGQEIPFRPLQLSYADANPKFIEAYATLFSGTGKMNYDAGNDILQEGFQTAMLYTPLTWRQTCVDPPLILMSCKKEISLLTSSSQLHPQLPWVWCATENLKTSFTLIPTEMLSMISLAKWILMK